MKRFLIFLFVLLNIQTAFAAERIVLEKQDPSLEVQILKEHGTVTFEGTSTYYMRYPHLLVYLFQQQALLTEKNSRTIYIMGPGYIPERKAIPQLHELMALYSCAGVMFDDVTVVDSSRTLLDAIPTSSYEHERARRILTGENNFENKVKGKLIFDNPSYGFSVLNGFVESIEALPKDMKTVCSDFNTMQLKDSSIDIMIGTFSLSYAMTNRPESAIQNFSKKILHSLKKGGALYVDFETGTAIRSSYKGDRQFEFFEIPHFTSNEEYGYPVLKFLTLANVDNNNFITTSSIFEIKRK